MGNEHHSFKSLSPWWRHTVIIVMVIGFTILIWLSVRTYSDAPPIPERVEDSSGQTLFTRADILAGQQVFLKYGLMENGSIWGHGAYLGPDFSAEYLHTLSIDASETIARRSYGNEVRKLNTSEANVIHAEVEQLLKQNRYHLSSQTLLFTDIEALSYRRQLQKWTTYFIQPANNFGLPGKYISNATDIKQLTSFFAWTAWERNKKRSDNEPLSFPCGVHDAFRRERVFFLIFPR